MSDHTITGRGVRRTTLAAAALGLSACTALFPSCGGGGAAAPPAPPAGAIPSGQALGSASITGHVLLEGPPPAREKITITESACRHGRSEEPLAESVVVGAGGGLKNVVVHVRSGLGDRVFAPPAEPVQLDQKGCIFVPHVLPVQTNQIIVFLNSDPTLHNVHAVTKANPGFNLPMAFEGQKLQRFFGRPEIVRIKCDVHSWMTSYITVLENPYYSVTGDDGAFRIVGLPAGTYEVEAWHESYGSRSGSVTVADGAAGTLDFTFSSPSR